MSVTRLKVEVKDLVRIAKDCTYYALKDMRVGKVASRVLNYLDKVKVDSKVVHYKVIHDQIVYFLQFSHRGIIHRGNIGRERKPA